MQCNQLCPKKGNKAVRALEQVKELGLFRLQKRRLRGYLIALQLPGRRLW